MPLQYRLTRTIGDILFKWDYLGFNSKQEAADAILMHDDWQQRWDLCDADGDDIQAVCDWKAAVLAANRGDIFGQLGDAFKL